MLSHKEKGIKMSEILKYGFFKNPELHLNANGAKPQWKEMFVPKFDKMVAFANSSEFDVVGEDDETNNRRVIFFSNVVDGFAEKKIQLLDKLHKRNLDMSFSKQYSDEDGNIRISAIVHQKKGTSILIPEDY